MADLTKQGRWRTELAMRQLALLDHEATGQPPAPYRPQRRRMPSAFMRSLVAVMSAKPAPKPRRRAAYVVETERSGCSICQNRWVRAVALIAIAVFGAHLWLSQDFVQDHLTGHNGAIYGETEVVFDE